MTQTELLERLRNSNKKAAKNNLLDWECGKCRTSGTREDAIVIEDSDDSDGGLGEKKVVDLIGGSRDKIAVKVPLATPATPTLRDDLPPAPFTPPAPPPVPAPTPQPPSLAAHRSKVLDSRNSRPPPDAAEIPASTSHRKPIQTHGPPKPSTLPLRLSDSQNLSDDPELPGIDNVRTRYQPPRLRNAAHGSRPIQTDDGRETETPQELSREEAEVLKELAYITIDGGHDVGEAGDKDEDAPRLDEDEDVDVSQAGWPEGYVEPLLPPYTQHARGLEAEQEDYDALSPIEQWQRSRPRPGQLPNPSFFSRASRDNAFPRLDMFYKYSPNLGLGTAAVPAQVARKKRGRKPAVTRRLPPEMTGSEVIYLAPTFFRIGESAPARDGAG